jgi:hypothetical protein
LLKMMIVSLLLTGTAVGAHGEVRAKPGDWARYGFVLAKQDAKPSIEEITITIGDAESGMVWWEMAAKKPGGGTFAVRVLSERAPMIGVADGIGAVKRYLFKDGGRAFVEYKDKSSGGALLPEFDFRAHLLPRQTPGTALEGAFATTGTYLGNGVQLLEHGAGKPLAAIGECKVLLLDPTLIIGTGRDFRDIDVGRITDRNYNYRPFLPEEYDEMEAAGVNFFTTNNSERESWVYERPAFYTKAPLLEDFPNIFYRSNYRGVMMFTDEPAILTSFADCRQVTSASNLLRMEVAASIARRDGYSPLVLPAHLEKLGVSLGTWDLRQRDIPAWEAVFSAAYNEMEGGVSGVYHEGRYDLKMFNGVLAGVCGPGFDVTAEQMLALHYAFLRGAARCFNGWWGTSIYGQADPAISPTAIDMAYDMGARYIWFWTSDNGHHMPYREQLDLTKALRQHEKAHPRRPVGELLRKAKVAVEFPEGYIGWSEFWPNGIWNNERFGFAKLNEQGVTYGSVVAAALKQGVLLARQGVQFDFVVDGESARKAGYNRLIHVRTDGTVENGVSAKPAK